MKCDYCGRTHKRKRFCSNKCKDRWHNKHNPRGFQSPDVSNAFDYDFDNTDYASGWDEDGWIDDDSGVGKF